MADEQMNSTVGDGEILDALEEIRACETDLQTFLDGLFDRLEGLADGLLVREAAARQTKQADDSPPSKLDEQIERLTALANNLAESISKLDKAAADNP